MPAAAIPTTRRLTALFADAARHIVHGFPAPVRARLSAVVAWCDRRRLAPPVDNWSRPLIATDSSVAPRTGSGMLATVFETLDVVYPGRPRSPVVAGGDGPPPMRCLLVTCALDVGGLAEVVAFLARRLPAHRLQTAVLHASPDPSAADESTGRLGRMLRSIGIEVHEADERGAAGWIERWRPDVISAHHPPDWVLGVAQRLGVPYVDNLHGMHDLFGKGARAEVVRSKKLSAVIAVSGLVRQRYLADNRGFPPGRIVVIPNAIDDERRPRGDRTAARELLGLTHEYVFVSLARLCAQKNCYGLLTAFAELARHRPEAHLVLAGGRQPHELRYYREVLRLRDSLRCRDRIHLRDHLASPFGLVAAADGFVLDSFFEGWSLASMEALFAGLPVVLSDVGGAREQVGDDPARGYVVANPLGDPLNVDWESIRSARYRPQVNRDEFVTAMEHLVANRQDYLRDRERLAAGSAARFDADVCLARQAAALRAVATGSDLPGSDVTDATFLPAVPETSACGDSHVHAVTQ
jgi:glycosyltransferase involved in cell wall biosynthesis